MAHAAQKKRRRLETTNHTQTSKKGKRARTPIKVPPKASPGLRGESTKSEERKEKRPTETSNNRNSPS